MASNKKKLKKEIVAVDLFCGVGGLTYGLRQGGVRVAAGIDIDENCRFPFEANNDAEFLNSDVAKLEADLVTRCFKDAKYRLIAGCAPCQPFSTYSRAGGRTQSSDWRLVEEFGRIVRDVQPEFVTMENVPPLADQPVFLNFLKCLDGYHVDWGILQCSNLGIPQTRKRLVLLASKFGKVELPAYTHEIKTVWDAIASLPRLGAGEQDPKDPMHMASKLSTLNMQRIRASKPGGTWRDWPASLRADCHKKASGETFPSVYGRMEWDNPSPTITTQCFGYGNGRFGHPEQDRAISLREAAMLQTFPKRYKFIEPGSKPSFSKLGRLIGNAVPVVLGQRIAEQFSKHIDEFAA